MPSLSDRGLVFRPPIYLSDEWGCPDGIARIGVPFYLADERLCRIEEELTGEVEDETESMRYLRHEAGHAFNYAYRLYDRADWHTTFGSFAEPYRDNYFPDPFSTSYVRHVLGWYAQKHPDEDFAETFAVWLTPHMDWRAAYEGWGALEKLEYVDRVMGEVGSSVPDIPDASEDDADVGDLHHTLAESNRLLSYLTWLGYRIADGNRGYNSENYIFSKILKKKESLQREG